MVIVEREGKYFLQLTNGELELSEKQAKVKLEKGAVLKEDIETPQEIEYNAESTIEPIPETGISDTEVNQPETAPADTDTTKTEQIEVLGSTIWDTSSAEDSPLTGSVTESPDIWSQPAEDSTPEVEIQGAQEITLEQEPVQEEEAQKEEIEEPVLQEAEFSLSEELQQATISERREAKTGHRHSRGESRSSSHLMPVSKVPNTANAFILSDEYYDSIIREFERVYVSNGRKDETALELLEYCQKSIDHLKIERAQPNADLALLDYQRLGWLRIIVFLQALTGVAAPKHDISGGGEKIEREKDITRQMLVIQLLQETGSFPYADALKSITHDSIVGLISRILDKDKSLVKASMQRSGDILLRRNVTPANAARRLRLLAEVEKYFAELPYNHVIIRLKSLKEFYKKYHIN